MKTKILNLLCNNGINILPKNGDKITITWLPSCVNVPIGTPNPYIGMSGEVYDIKDGKFDLFTGSSWLVGIELKNCKFVFTNPEQN